MDVAALVDRKAKRSIIAAKVVRDKVPLHNLLDEFPEMVYDYKRIKQSVAEWHLDADVPIEREVRCVWLYGKPGVGKTRRAVDDMGKGDLSNIYFKPCNKWWDGYRNQDVIILDDVCKNDGEWLCQKLKVWCDRYPGILEFKGGAVTKRYGTFVITSNHSIEAIFGTKCSQIDVEALKRRFEEIEVKKDLMPAAPRSSFPSENQNLGAALGQGGDSLTSRANALLLELSEE